MADSKLYNFQWKRGVDIPCPITWCKTTLIGDNKVYVADYSDRLKVFSYVPETDEWAFLDEEKSPPTMKFALAGVNKKLVCVGGEDMTSSKKPSNIVTVWDEGSKTWVHPYPAMTKVRRDPCAVGWGRYLIVIGGTSESGNGVFEIEILDVTSSQWSVSGNSPAQNVTSLLVIQDTLYLLGDGDKVFTASLPQLVAPGTKDSLWTALPNAPVSHISLFSLNNKLLSAGGLDVKAGGDDGGIPTSSIFLYDQDEKVWKKVSDLPEPCFECCCTPLSESKGLVVIGGWKSSKAPHLLQAVNIGMRV